MKKLKLFAMMLCIAAMGLAIACSKDDDKNNDDYSVTPTSLVGTKWSASATMEDGNQYYISLSFTSSTQVLMTQRLGTETETGNGTYVYHAPQGTMYYTWDYDSYEVNFSVDGPVMKVAFPGNPNAVLTRE